MGRNRRPKNQRRQSRTSPSPVAARPETEGLIAAARECFDDGDFTSALRHAEAALAAEPENEDWLEIAAYAAAEARGAETGLGFMERLTRRRPDDAGLFNDFGIMLQLVGRIEPAADAFRRSTELDPSLAASHSNLGMALVSLGRLADAESACRQAVALEADAAPFHANLANVLTARRRPHEAVAAFRRAVALDPMDADAGRGLCSGLMEIGAMAEAETVCRRLLGRDPTDDGLCLQLGVILKAAGNLGEAARVFRGILKRTPDFADAFFQLSELRSGSLDDDDLAAMETLLESGSLDDQDRVALGIAIGNVHDQRGDAAQAFARWDAANALQCTRARYDFRNDEAWLRLVEKRLDRDSLPPAAETPEPSAPRPIFIVGMPRSGSTLIEQILASHSSVQGGGELNILLPLVTDQGLLHGYDSPDSFRLPVRKDLIRLRESYYRAVEERIGGSPVITDKTPNNYQLIGIILAALPGAVIVNSVRDPIDTCLACFMRYFAKGQEFSYNLEDLGRYYRMYHRLTSHWRRSYPDLVLDVRYEDIVSGTEDSVRRLLDHCRLPWEDACLDFHKAQRTVRTASASQVRRPIYSESIGRADRYRQWLTPLVDALGDIADT